MSTIQKFEDLECWQLARELSRLIFGYTQKSPFNKDFRFRDQINAASGSIMDNIAEGFGRGGNKEFVNQLTISLGSATEVQSQLYRAYDYGYISEEEFQKGYDLANQIIQKAGNLITYLKKSGHKGQKFK